MPRHTKKGRNVLAALSLTNPRPSFTAPTLTAGMPLTVGQIADQLRSLAPDAAETRERIRHWTREGLLSPIASHHSGTGKHRKYDASSVYDAAILNAVARAGLHVVTQTLPARGVVRGPPRTTEIGADQNQGTLFLEISHQAVGGRAPVIAIHEGAVKCDPAAGLSIVINLAQIFKEVQTSDR
jgi:hypothetical protein